MALAPRRRAKGNDVSEFVLKAHTGVTGTGPRWQCLSDEPWLLLETRKPLAGRWIILTWSAGLLDPVCRPVLRYEFDDGFFDTFLSGAPFGRGCFIVFVPHRVRRVLISPTNQPGETGFRLDRLGLLSPIRIRLLAAMRSPFLALWALGANLIGRPRDARSLLRDALAVQPMTHYARWRKRGSRSVDVAGVDGEEAARINQIPLFSAGSPAHVPSPAPQPSKDALLPATDLDRVLAGLEEHELIGVLQEGVTLEPSAVNQVVAAAQRNPESDVFFGDCEQFTAQRGTIQPHLRAGFDLMLLDEARLDIGAVFVRARALKRAKACFISQGGRLVARLQPACKVENLFRVLSRESALPRPAPKALVPPPSTPELAAGEDAEAAIIIPTKNRYRLIKPCIDSLLACTQGRYQLIVVDNGTTDADASQYLLKIRERDNVKVISSPGSFNFSALCNLGARHANASVLVFLNNDTEALTAEWLQLVVPLALRPDIGAVGAKLLFDNRTVQHVGCVVGMGGRAGHFEHGMAADDPGFFRRANRLHRVSAVTGAFLAVARSKFEAVGRFDEENLPIDLNDIDLCLRLREAGHDNVIHPGCVFLHHESASRGHLRNSDAVYARERKYFARRWFRQLRDDPYFTPVLSLYASDPALG